MARLGLQRAIGAEWVNEVFEEHSKSQYTRELLFSAVVDLMSLVALGMRPSLHAAAQKMKDNLPVSLTALYDKVTRVEPEVVRALDGPTQSVRWPRPRCPWRAARSS